MTTPATTSFPDGPPAVYGVAEPTGEPSSATSISCSLLLLYSTTAIVGFLVATKHLWAHGNSVYHYPRWDDTFLDCHPTSWTQVVRRINNLVFSRGFVLGIKCQSICSTMLFSRYEAQEKRKKKVEYHRFLYL